MSRLLRLGVLVGAALPMLTGAAPPEALEPCYAQQHRGERSLAATCFHERQRTADAAALRAEAAWALGDIRVANDLFREAAEAAPDDAAVRVRWARLYMDVHQEADAEALLQEALKLDPESADGRIAYAELLAGRFEGRARTLVNEVLGQHPDHVPALLLHASLALELGETEPARAAVERVLDAAQTPPGQRLEAMALAAAADRLDGRAESPWTEKALDINPHYGRIYSIPARFFVITRRYADAVAMLQKAVALDPTLAHAHAALGVNLLRLNEFGKAREHLEHAYELDPYDATVVNTLRLLDSMTDFELSADESVIVRAHEDEAAVLGPYVRELVNEALRVFGERYDFTPKRPVVVELYPQHDDFAVRTAGLPGIGILGATFGYVLAMDSPSARSIDEGFDWTSTLWHELAHVVTLDVTDHLVTRWFSEGVSVYEEWQTGPSARRSVPLVFLNAYSEDRLLPIAELDEGFIRPRYPQQVSVSYLQAGLICEFIAERFGHDKLNAMLRGYRQGLDTAEVVQSALSMAPEAFDGRFDDYLAQRFGALTDALDLFQKHLTEAGEALEADEHEHAITAAAEAVSLYPEYVESGSPYLLLAAAHEAAGDIDAMTDTLRDYWQAGGREPEALAKLAAALEQRDAHEARSEIVPVRRDLALVAPFDGEHHGALGDRLLADGAPVDAAREYRMLLALDPHDRASAHLRLARAYRALNEMDRARQELLYALEIAPRYQPALSLLLEINEDE